VKKGECPSRLRGLEKKPRLRHSLERRAALISPCKITLAMSSAGGKGNHSGNKVKNHAERAYGRGICGGCERKKRVILERAIVKSKKGREGEFKGWSKEPQQGLGGVEGAKDGNRFQEAPGDLGGEDG